MGLNYLALIGGVWLSLLYSACVTPATVWVIQLTVSRGIRQGGMAAMGLAAGQWPWAVASGLLLFQFPQWWQMADPVLRGLTCLFLAWMAFRNARAPRIQALRLVLTGNSWNLFTSSLWRSMLMPWRLPLWASLIVVMSIHLRGPGWESALFFSLGCLVGMLAWLLHFLLLAGLFGGRVPEDITLRSMNKLRLLATIVPLGLIVVCLAPMAIA